MSMGSSGAGGRGGLLRFDPSMFRGQPPEVQEQAKRLTKKLTRPVRGQVYGSAATQYVASAYGRNSFSIKAGSHGKVEVMGIEPLRDRLVVEYTDRDGQRRQAPVDPDLADELEERNRALAHLEEAFRQHVEDGTITEAMERELQVLVDQVRSLQSRLMAKIDRQLGLSKQLLETNSET